MNNAIKDTVVSVNFKMPCCGHISQDQPMASQDRSISKFSDWCCSVMFGAMFCFIFLTFYFIRMGQNLVRVLALAMYKK